jgi:Ribosomal protein L13
MCALQRPHAGRYGDLVQGWRQSAPFCTLPRLFHDLKANFMYTVFSKPDEIRGDWYLVDATGKTLGRLASEIALRLKGKHKPTYAPHQDVGDHIVVINAGNVRVTGAKLTDKFYHQHTG